MIVIKPDGSSGVVCPSYTRQTKVSFRKTVISGRFSDRPEPLMGFATFWILLFIPQLTLSPYLGHYTLFGTRTY